MTENRDAAITKLQELVYELRIEQVMEKDVITIGPQETMGDLKRLLQENKISGTPVCDGDRLLGIVSIEDLLKALEAGEQDALIRDKMTSNVQTLHADESVLNAVNLFAQTGYGRLPVTDRENKLVGIMTKGDIVRGLLHQMEVAQQEEEVRRYRASHIFEDIVSDQTGLILRYRVEAKNFVHGGSASSKLKRALVRLGGSPQLVRRIAIATYEAEMNLVIHTERGGEIIAEIMPERIRVVAMDNGPGIENVEQALEPGFSTAPDWIRELGFGAGMGLSNIKACADDISLRSKMSVGTRLEIIFNLEKNEGVNP